MGLDSMILVFWMLSLIFTNGHIVYESILNEINPEYSLKGLMLKLKLQYFGNLIMNNWFIEKDPDAGKDWRQEEKGMTEDEMVRWHHRLDGHEFA